MSTHDSNDDSSETSSSSMCIDYNQEQDGQQSNDDSIIKQIQNETSEAIHMQALKIVDTLESYQELEDKNPTVMLASIDKSTNSMVDTWSAYYSQLELATTKKNEGKDDERFRKVYMEMITEAFADELDDLRHGRVKDQGKKKKKKTIEDDDEELLKQQNIVVPSSIGQAETLKGNDVKVLVSCLESGMDIWTEEERQFLLSEKGPQQRNTKTDKDTLTLHERKRRALFGE
jgi:ABC-type transporter MlaC component